MKQTRISNDKFYELVKKHARRKHAPIIAGEDMLFFEQGVLGRPDKDIHIFLKSSSLEVYKEGNHFILLNAWDNLLDEGESPEQNKAILYLCEPTTYDA